VLVTVAAFVVVAPFIVIAAAIMVSISVVVAPVVVAAAAVVAEVAAVGVAIAFAAITVTRIAHCRRRQCRQDGGEAAGFSEFAEVSGQHKRSSEREDTDGAGGVSWCKRGERESMA
jgi:hypothetical protein